MPGDFYVFFYGTAMDRRYAKKGDSIFNLYQKAINISGHDNCLLVDGPGSYQNKNGFLSWVNPKDWYNYNMSYLGILTGNHGPNSVLDNVNNAFKKIKENAPDRIFLTGHSRGAIEAFMLANLLYFDKDTRNIPVRGSRAIGDFL